MFALAFNGGTFKFGSSSAMLVSRSINGGTAWSNPIELIHDGVQFFNDKNAITADPTNSNYVYAVWDRLVSTGGGPTYFARTTNGGVTWEAARPIYDPGPSSQTIGARLRLLCARPMLPSSPLARVPVPPSLLSATSGGGTALSCSTSV